MVGRAVTAAPSGNFRIGPPLAHPPLAGETRRVEAVCPAVRSRLERRNCLTATNGFAGHTTAAFTQGEEI